MSTEAVVWRIYAHDVLCVHSLESEREPGNYIVIGDSVFARYTRTMSNKMAFYMLTDELTFRTIVEAIRAGETVLHFEKEI